MGPSCLPGPRQWAISRIVSLRPLFHLILVSPRALLLILISPRGKSVSHGDIVFPVGK